MTEADTVSESNSRASMHSAHSVISMASNAAGEVMKFTTKNIVWFLLYAFVICGYLILPGSSSQECLFLTQIGCGKATAWVALRLVVDASVILGTYFGLQSAVSPVVVYKEYTSTTTSSTREPPYNYDRVRRGTLEDIEAAVNKATELFHGVNSSVKITSKTPPVANSTVKITTKTPTVANSTEKVAVAPSLPSNYTLINDLNVTSQSTMAGLDPASTEHPLTKAFPSEELNREALIRVTIGLGSWALTMVLALTIICHYRRANGRLQRRVHRLRAGLSSIARSEMRPYAVELEGPIQTLARIQAHLAAGSIEHNSAMEEEGNLPPPPPPPSPRPRRRSARCWSRGR